MPQIQNNIQVPILATGFDWFQIELSKRNWCRYNRNVVHTLHLLYFSRNYKSLCFMHHAENKLMYKFTSCSCLSLFKFWGWDYSGTTSTCINISSKEVTFNSNDFFNQLRTNSTNVYKNTSFLNKSPLPRPKRFFLKKIIM